MRKGHRHRLLEMYQQRYGEHLPPIRRENVKGFLRRRPIWLTRNQSLDAIRREAKRWSWRPSVFTRARPEQASDVGVRKLLGDLAELEKGHETLAGKLTQSLTPDARAAEEKTRHRMFVLQYVQPGLAGLMDGSVSTLAPLFAAAFATHHNWQTFLVGLAASIGAASAWVSPELCPTTDR